MSSTDTSSTATHRVIDRFVVHGEPTCFRDLCREVLSTDTRYLVLDLDGTVLLDRNLGELLGWELSALRSYGLPTMDRLEHRRGGSRWLFDWGAPRELARYLAMSARSWSGPGAHYFIWSKLASRIPWLRRAGFRRFRADPVRSAQRGVQTTLMKQLDAVPADIVPVLMERIWRRHEIDQVITADDVRWVRETYPRTTIVLSSASPEPVVRFAAERLGIEHAHGSTPGQINSGPMKVRRLAQAFPTSTDPDVEIVGVSDTAHGDDHCWTEHFTKVVDVNSPAPFPLIAPERSPLREVHSATVLTRRELAERGSTPGYLDPRRKRSIAVERRELTQRDLLPAMKQLVDRFNAVSRSAERLTQPADVAFRLATLRESSRACLV